MVLLQQLVQVHIEQLEDEAEMLAVHEVRAKAHDVAAVVRVGASVKQLQNANFHACLLVIGSKQLDHFHSDHLARPQAARFHNLPERAPAQHVLHLETAAPFARRRSEHVAHAKDQITVLICSFCNLERWFREHSSARRSNDGTLQRGERGAELHRQLQ